MNTYKLMNHRERKLYMNKYGADFQIVRAKRAINTSLIIALIVLAGFLFIAIKGLMQAHNLVG